MTTEEINILNQKLQGDPKISSLMKQLEINPKDNSIRYQLAELQFKNGIHQDAIDNCLDVYKLFVFYIL
jgi:thioredoxin-like negative regulator of GroEL